MVEDLHLIELAGKPIPLPVEAAEMHGIRRVGERPGAVDHAGRLPVDVEANRAAIERHGHVRPRVQRRQAVPADRLTIALKTASEDLRAHIFSSMSKRAAERIREDMEVLGGVRLADVEAALTEVPEPHRTAFRLHALEGQSYAEIAKRLAVPSATVGTRILRARRWLKEVLTSASASNHLGITP